MAEVEETQFTSLAERIAALNRQKNFEVADAKSKRAAPPPPPQRLATESRSQTVPIVATTNSPQIRIEAQRPAMPPRPTKAAPPPLPRRPTGASPAESPAASPGVAPPPLPSRTPSNQHSPALPPRRPAATSTPPTDARRNSASSEISHISTLSSASAGRTSISNFSSVSDGPSRKLPPAFDPASLPPLPPTRRAVEGRNQEAREEGNGDIKSRYPLVSNKNLPNVRPLEPPPPARPSLPPRLPSRPARSPGLDQDSQKPITPRRLPPPPSEYKSPVNGHRANGDAPPPLPSTSRDARDSAPPVPACSRPSDAQIQAASDRAAANQTASCLLCRDFSVPDRVGSQYPRHTVPRNDPVGFLARALCDPFGSATDKARSIFAWMHYNVVYDVELFRSGACRRVTPEDVIFEGKGVCAGYAGCYEAIARRAGLDCIMVTGHGKGVGYSPLKKGQPCPPKNATGHAWNAVRIDDGEWKLIDACWGAGHLDSNTGQQKQEYNPGQFTKSNEDFGASHFPQDSRHFFRSDGRNPTWEEYFTGGLDGSPPHIYGDFEREGCRKQSLSPRERQIPVYSGEVVRFQMSRPCEHWTFEKNGQGAPRVFLLAIKGLDGRNETYIPMDTDGFWWWADINARDLGAPGQDITMMALTKVGDRDARGVTKEEYLRSKGKVGMAFSFMAKWELV